MPALDVPPAPRRAPDALPAPASDISGILPADLMPQAARIPVNVALYLKESLRCHIH